MKRAYEYVVVGVGGLGSAAAYRLAREAGSEVLALEQFPLGHDYGASQDHSRIIRLSYHDAAYTALTPHTYTAWAEVEAESGIHLVHKTGGLDIAPAGCDAADRYGAAMTAADIPFEELTADEAMARFPQWRLDGDERVLYQADSGLVDARQANAAHVALARLHGATVLDETPVHSIRAVGAGVEVVTAAGVFQAAKLIVCADAWTNQVLSGVGVSWPLTVTQEQVTYWATPHLRRFAPDRFPIFIWHGKDFYGFPVYGEVATKAGIDVGGDAVTTETRTFDKNPRADAELCAFLDHHLPGYTGPELSTKTCLYTMPPDRTFTIDALPGYPQIVVAQGAAHAFKFAALIGKILADLAVRGRTGCPIEAFAATRPALTDPEYEVALHI
ncbi:MAG: N-methyl-L-tryptophan oxidase [Chloroflexia bacterium]|nr:N-methyl-L-tryptophan oxidase [Chloroflexia bacterium]